MQKQSRSLPRLATAALLSIVWTCAPAVSGWHDNQNTPRDQIQSKKSITSTQSSNTYLIDGTSYSHFYDLPPLQDGDRIEIDPDHIIYEGEFVLNGLDGITITRKTGTSGYATKRNATPLPMTTLISTGSFDVWKSEPRMNINKPMTVWEEWDNPLNVDANGFHTAFVHENTTGLSDLSSTRSWWWDSGTNTLYVSVPSGIDASTQQYLVGIPGHGIVLSNSTNCTIEYLSTELTTEPGNGNGYGIRESFNSSGNRVQNCRFRANQYHCLGSVANSASLISQNNDFAECIAGVDSQLVFYSRIGITHGSKSINDTFHMVPWLDTKGNPHAEGKIIAIGAHNDKDAHTAVGGIQIINPTCISYGYNAEKGDVFLSLTAAFSAHYPPAIEDELTPSMYPIIIQGGTLNVAIPALIGGNVWSKTSAAFVGTTININSKHLTEFTVGGACIVSICGDPSDRTDSTLGLFSCTISATMSQNLNGQTIFGAGRHGARLIIENCSINDQNQYNSQHRIFSFSATAGLAKVQGCAIDVADTDTRLCAGNTTEFRDDPSRFVFSSNLYTSVLNNNFWAGEPIITRDTFQTIYDTDGRYETDPSFLDQTTLEPDTALNELDNVTKPLGPWGINNEPYSRRYGAWQLPIKSNCTPDLNADGVLDFFDISAFLSAFSIAIPVADFTGDGEFDFFDISAFLTAFSAGCP